MKTEGAKMDNGRKENVFHKFKRKAGVIRSMEEMQDRTASGHEMHKVLGALDLVLLGIGCIVGAGIMVLTGVAALKYAGPGVTISYSLSAVAALLTSFCYAEYAADLPVAGGAFNYIGMTFGEFAAWVAACDLILEYTLSAAAVAKGFTAYFASFCGFEIHRIRFQAGFFSLDFLACGMVIAMSLVLARSTRESSLLNSIVVALHMALIIFVLAAGFPKVDTDNYHPFTPYGTRGVFTGAAVVFFSYIGFDTVATAAEEVKNPARDLPIGIVGSLSICTVLYVLMCLVITGMQPYYALDEHAPFSVAFRQVGLGWAEKIVAAGALAGIVTSLLGSLLGQARIYVTLGRQHLLPAWLARVNPDTGTPRNATLITMFTAGTLALLFDIEVLAELVSIGTLVVFAMVCAGVLFRRYHVRNQGDSMNPVLYRLGSIILFSVSFSISYIEEAHIAVPIIFLILWAVATGTFHMLPVKYVPAVFKCPLSPWLPSLGILFCLHLIGSLGWPAYVRWIIWFTIGTTVYFTYSIHHSQGEGNSRIASMANIAVASSSNGGIEMASGGDHRLRNSMGDREPTGWLLDGMHSSSQIGMNGKSGLVSEGSLSRGDTTSQPLSNSQLPALNSDIHSSQLPGASSTSWLVNEQQSVAHRRHVSATATSGFTLSDSPAGSPRVGPGAALAQPRAVTPGPGMGVDRQQQQGSNVRHNPRSFT